jgi:hypothetical protein
MTQTQYPKPQPPFNPLWLTGLCYLAAFVLLYWLISTF